MALEWADGKARPLPENQEAAAERGLELSKEQARERIYGMPFAEWRQRLRVVRAMPLLEAGQTVETIALDLGYGSASAFIAMFKKLMGTTPDELRRGTLTTA